MKTICKKLIYTSIITCLFTISSFGQSSEQPADSIDYNALSEKLMGTYQIQMIDTRTLPSFPAELLLLIEKKRDENRIIYHRLSDNMRIKILPKSIINTKEFKPVERIRHISSKDL